MIGVINRFFNWLSIPKSKAEKHHHYQRKSKRCVVCGKKLLRYESRGRNGSKIIASTKFSGGKISCPEHNANHANWCVHGTLMENECEFCPTGERIHNLGQLERKYD